MEPMHGVSNLYAAWGGPSRAVLNTHSTSSRQVSNSMIHPSAPTSVSTLASSSWSEGVLKDWM